jgi:prolyl oligopeptidase
MWTKAGTSVLYSSLIAFRPIAIAAFTPASSIIVPARPSFSSRITRTNQIAGRSTMATDTTKNDSDTANDPYIWLEDVESEESLSFAKSANEKCLASLGDPTDKPTYERVLKILESKDRIAHVTNHGRDETSTTTSNQRVFYNFWKDSDHPKGIWRKTTEDEYNNPKDDPIWTTVLDIDELAKKDDIGWVYKGASLLPRGRDSDPIHGGKLVTRALCKLSRGGSDAVHLKEFDLITQDFVSADDGGFILPEAKIRANYKSRDTLLVGSDFGEGSLTDSGYPRVVKEWNRGTSIDDAPTVFEGESTDVAVNGYVADERNWGGNLWQVHSRSITFYTSKYWMAKLTEDHLLKPEDRPTDLTEPEFKELEIQDDASLDYMGNILFIILKSDWTPNDNTGITYKQGSVIYCNFEKFWLDGKSAVDYTILFEPTEQTAYEYFTVTKNYLILSTTDTVKSKLGFYKLDDSGTSLSLVSGGKETEAKIRACSCRPIDYRESDEFWFTTSDYTTPSTLYSADASKMECSESSDNKEEDAFIVQKLKTLPPQYDSDDLCIEQKFATSKDGTKIPYFMVRKSDIELNGKNPTLLYGYGGFEISLGPRYIPSVGLAWLERGGVYVEANIRGGGYQTTV